MDANPIENQSCNLANANLTHDSRLESVSEKLWNKYFERLLRFATRQMRGMPKIASDEEDVTLSVLKSVCLNLREQSNIQVDSSGIWCLLVLICKRKIANQYAYQLRGKRDASRSESLSQNPALLEELQADEIQPQRLIEINESLESLFAALEKEPLKQIALAKVQGYTNQEIANQRNCSLSTVERKLRVIREIWSQSCESE